MLSLLVFLPLLFVLLLNLPFAQARREKVSFALTALFALSQSCWTLCPAFSKMVGTFSALDLFFPFQPLIDTLTVVSLLSIGLVLLTALCVGYATLEKSRERVIFSNLLLLSLAGMNGVVLARDLFSLYVYIEVVAVSSYILITIEKTAHSFEGAFKYLLLSALATTCMLSSLGLILLYAPDTTFAAVSQALRTEASLRLLGAALALFLVGLFIKGGLVPFHGWVPDAYGSASAGASVLLAGIATKITGVYTLLRVVFSIFPLTAQLQLVLLALGAISIVVGALLALGQDDMKRMLAYSSISQLGYIVLGLGSFSTLGYYGAILHLFNHAVFKSLLFTNAAAVEKACGSRSLSQLGGLGAKMPITNLGSAVAFLSTAGIPPFSGFFSKLMIVLGLWQVGFFGFASLAVLASIITLAYFLSLQRQVFFGPLREHLAQVKEAGLLIILPTLLLTSITLGVGLAFPWLFGTFLVPVRSFLL